MARCKYGKLKNPVGGRRCRKSRARKSVACAHGKLKNPIGGRRCRKRRASRNPGQTAWRRARTINNKMDRSFGRR